MFSAMSKKEYCWEVMWQNLREGREMPSIIRQLDEILAGTAEDKYEGNVWIWFDHAYHHLNWAWGCRNATEERAVKCAWRDFKGWEKFPLAFKSLLPDRPRRALNCWRDAKWYPESMKLGLGNADKILGEIISGVRAHCEESEVEPITIGRFGMLMEEMLGEINFAWNVRRIPLDKVMSLSEKSKARYRWYPPEFAEKFTKRHYRIKEKAK